MEKSTKHKITAYLEFIVGAILFGAGIFIAVDAWGVTGQIRGAGLLGQAVYQEEYNQAVTNMTIGVLLIGVGFLGVLNGLAEDIKSTLYELNED